MTRLFIFLFTLSVSSIAAVWFIENDGSIVIEWLGYRIQTSVAFAVVSSVILLVLLTVILQFLIFVKSAPKRFRRALKDKRRENGLAALTNGFAAIAAGDIKESKRLTRQSIQYLGNIPLTRLLSAQSAQLEGNNDLARVHYTAMLESKETETIAIKGLLVQARQEGDINKAIFLAQKAVTLHPDAAWAINMLIDLYKLAKRWSDLEKLIGKARKQKIMGKEQATRTLAVIYLGMAYDMANSGHREDAIIYAKKSYKLMPGFVPAVYKYALLLNSSSNQSKAASIIEKCWKSSPHPALGNLYLEVYALEAPDKRLKKVERLFNIRRDSIDSHILVARAALGSDDLAKARDHLNKAIAIRETREICLLMAELERVEGSSNDIIDQWRQRSVTSNPDMAWSCQQCGSSAHSWSINCNNCNSFDSLTWGVDSTSHIRIISPDSHIMAA